MNTMDKQETQKRIIIATALSFLFFIAYDFLYIQPQQAVSNQQVVEKKINDIKNQAPETTSVSAPTQNNITPVVQKENTADIISTIKTKNSIIKIDSLGRVAQVILTKVQYKDDEGARIKLFTPEQLKPLEVRFANPTINQEAFKVQVQASKDTIDASAIMQTLVLTQKLSNLTLTKTLTFYPEGKYDIDIKVSNNEPFFYNTRV
jgi:YidC/Oxa1 family membrane protein insertase